MDDITGLVLDDHEAFRRGFARLDDARGETELRAIWDPLSPHPAGTCSSSTRTPGRTSRDMLTSRLPAALLLFRARRRVP